MSTIIIGDIHGNLLALRDLLRRVRSEAGNDDYVVLVLKRSSISPHQSFKA